MIKMHQKLPDPLGKLKLLAAIWGLLLRGGGGGGKGKGMGGRDTTTLSGYATEGRN